MNWNQPATRPKRLTLSRSVSGSKTKLVATPVPARTQRSTPEPPLTNPLEQLTGKKTAPMQPSASSLDSSAEPQITRRIWEELKKDFGDSDSPHRSQNDISTSVSSVSSIAESSEKFGREPLSPRHEAASQATAAVTLIQQIETFVRSNRPGLAIQLDGRLAARIEIEKLGPREVALRLVGKNGPPSAENVGRIREELRGRGIRIGAITVA
jgi:hypothetical protein